MTLDLPTAVIDVWISKHVNGIKVFCFLFFIFLKLMFLISELLIERQR